MHHTPLPVSPLPSSASMPSRPPSAAPSSSISPSSPPIAVPSPSIGTSPAAHHQREKTHFPQPQQQREPLRTENTHSPQPQRQREPSSPTLRRSHQTCKQRSVLNMDPSKKSYDSIAALDSTEETSLLKFCLHHLLLTEFGITDI